MKQYLINFFKYNDWANRKMLEAIKQLPDQSESVKLFSHVINSHRRWLNRITKKTDDSALSWSGETIPIDQLESSWADILNKWLRFIEGESDSGIEKDIIFQRPTDKKMMAVKIRDALLQLNYHSIHHRAQVLRMIRLQGQTPPATDYIFSVLREV